VHLRLTKTALKMRLAASLLSPFIMPRSSFLKHAAQMDLASLEIYEMLLTYMCLT